MRHLVGGAHRRRTVQAPDALSNAVCPGITRLQVGRLDQVQDTLSSRQANGPLEGMGVAREGRCGAPSTT